jgi:hypothetical protein
MNDNEILKEIYSEIKQIKCDIVSLKKDMESISQSTTNMDNHISFVESVWDVVKNPFSNLLQFYYGKNQNLQKLQNTESSTHQLQNI